MPHEHRVHRRDNVVVNVWQEYILNVRMRLCVPLRIVNYPAWMIQLRSPQW